ncbi:MAG: DUF6282 family protein [Caulobacteraceae bacterium]
MVRISLKAGAIGLLGLAAAGVVGVAVAAEGGNAAKPAVTWAPATNSVVNPSKNTSLDAWESYKGKSPKPSIDEHLQDPVLKGAIDVHAHFGPDSYDRQWDAFEIARIAHERGMRGLVLKNHWAESAGLAYMTRKYAGVPGLEVFGALVLNAPEGGINPQAVRYFAEVEGHYGKVVWMPTHDSENEVKYLKEIRPYVIVSQKGVLLPSVLQVLDLIAQYKLTLATGHVSSGEMVQIVTEAKKRGIEHIIITHPGLGPQYTDPTLDQMKQVAGMGAYAEVVSTELSVPSLRDKTIAMMKALGAAHCIVSTDSGLVGSRNHADAMVRAAQTLRAAGFSEADLDLMFKANPAKVLGLGA